MELAPNAVAFADVACADNPNATVDRPVVLAPSPIATELVAAVSVDALGPIAIELLAFAPVLSLLGLSLELIDTYLCAT